MLQGSLFLRFLYNSVPTDYQTIKPFDTILIVNERKLTVAKQRVTCFRKDTTTELCHLLIYAPY
ncbi:Uncharacterised protein [Capnocytophaga haemolytica]|uniref:RCK C-terminal domain-containing protein n=1 Tax=Capnocytophaga haemolytica TaxID=45243 RepID=A0AAX2H1A2_9FLAO|nr:Uncharacterised protein [Capnocytophaga haemolytica]